jgi:hypothetical protein
LLGSSGLLAAALSPRAFADVAGLLARIERLPRTERLQAYEAALADGTVPAADRTATIRAFARHSQQVSPLYSKGGFPFDPRRWNTLLREAFDPKSPDPTIGLTLAQALVDANDPGAAGPVLAALKTVKPDDHTVLAWSKWLETGGREEVLTFPVHFCVLTTNPAAQQAATRQQCLKECEILNATFRSLDGAPLARFELKGFSPYEAVKGANTELLAFGDPAGFDSAQGARAFNTCSDPRVRDPKAINIYVFDSRSAKGGEDATSHGKRNSNRPYVFLDWKRLNGNLQNAEAHEMGHAFGLEHVGVPGARPSTSTNIMTSAGEGFGSGGLRDLGFTPAQAALVRYHAARSYARLGLGRK